METTRATTTRPPVPQSVCFLLASNHAQACCQSGKCVASDSIYRGRNVPVRARKCKLEIAASDPKGAGRIYSKQARCSSGDATETPKASLIPAQGIRPGFIAPSTISSPEGATHPSSTPSNRLNALKQPIACTGKTGPYEPRANALGCYEAGRWPESNCVSPQTRIGQQGWPSLFTRPCLVRSFRGFPTSRVWHRRDRKV